MSELRDTVRGQIAGILSPALSNHWKPHLEVLIDKILSLPNIAVVDKEAKLPDLRDMLALVCDDYRILDKRKKALLKAVYELWGEHIESCLAGWVKEGK